MKVTSAARLLAAALTSLLVGCANPTLLSLDERHCDAMPMLSRDNTVELGNTWGTTVVFNETTRCLNTASGPASYVVFALPEATQPYRITFRSTQRSKAIIWPDVTVYGTDDRPRLHVASVREAAGAIVGSTTGEPGDHYLLVTSTPRTIGQHEAIPTASVTPPFRLAATVFIPVMVPAGPVGPVTEKISAILAHSGRVTVSALPFTTVQ